MEERKDRADEPALRKRIYDAMEVEEQRRLVGEGAASVDNAVAKGK